MGRSKRAIVILISVLAVCAIVGAGSLFGTRPVGHAGSADFAAGNGTPEDPYLVSCPAEFEKIRYHRDACFRQTTNLDFSDAWDFVPIGSMSFPFTGKYDGDRYSIEGIRIDAPEDSDVGIFSVLFSGEIRDVKLKNASISGGYNVGSVVGVNRGTIVGCVSEASVEGEGNVGGIAGINAVGGTIRECGNRGDVGALLTDCKFSGGIVGVNDGVISDCYNRRAVGRNAEAIYVGGLAGSNRAGARIERSYHAGEVFGTAGGPLAGDNEGGAIANCKWLCGAHDCFAAFDSGRCEGVFETSRSDFAQKQTFADWSAFEEIWRYTEGDDFPVLRREYVPVQSVAFDCGLNLRLKPGETRSIRTSISPRNATTTECRYNSLSGEGWRFDPDSGELSISADAAVGSVFSVSASAENCTAVLTVEVIPIPVQSLALFAEDGRDSLSAATSLKYRCEIFPADAGDKAVCYAVDSAWANITSDGVLTLLSGAPIGLNLVVTASSVQNPSVRSYAVATVEKVPVESVRISSPESFKVTESLRLTASVAPAEATYANVTYRIVSADAKGAILEGEVLRAFGVGTVTIAACADGVTSAPVTILVKKEPVTEIVFDPPAQLDCGKNVRLSARALPENATERTVRFDLAEPSNVARLKDGILYGDREGTVAVRASADGMVCERTISIVKIPVSRIRFAGADTFKHTESLTLSAEVLPLDATYRDIRYEVEPNEIGARISDGILRADRPGIVAVWAIADGETAVRTFHVTEEPVVRLTLSARFVEDDRGEAYRFETTVEPANATRQDVRYAVNGNATISADGLLLIDIANPVGTPIEVYAEAGGVKSASYRLTSGYVAVRRVTLSTEVSAAEAGGRVRLVSTTEPRTVSNPVVRYEIEGNARIEGDTLIPTRYAVGANVVRVRAVVDGVASEYAIVEILKTAVRSIEWNGETAFKITGSLPVRAQVLPAAATFPIVTAEILSAGGTGAELRSVADGTVLFAARPGRIELELTADGTSAIVRIQALPEPVTDVSPTCPNEVVVGHELRLTAEAEPSNATDRSVRFVVLDNEIGATVTDGIFLARRVGSATVRMYAGAIVRDFEIIVVKEPVIGIRYAGGEAFRICDSLELIAEVTPANATFCDVRFEILSGADFARIEGGRLFADRPGEIRLRFAADGVFGETIVRADKVPVSDIRIDVDLEVRLEGMRAELRLKACALPSNATYGTVSFAILGKKNCFAEISDGVVKVKIDEVGTADGTVSDEQGTVTILATADGVKKNFEIKLLKNPVIEVGMNCEVSAGVNAWATLTERTFSTADRIRFCPYVLPSNATATGVEAAILCEKAENSGEKVGAYLSRVGEFYELAASRTGIVTIRVRSACGAFGDFEFLITEEVVSETALGIEICSRDARISASESRVLSETANYGSDDIANYRLYQSIALQQGSELSLRGFARSADPNRRATYGDRVEIRYAENGGGVTLSAGAANEFFTLEGNLLKIRLDAPVARSFELYAVCRGIVSARTKITVESCYIDEINRARLEADGSPVGLQSLYNSDTGESPVEKVGVKIEHDSGIEIVKEFETSDPTVRLQLYNPTLGGSFSVEYTVYFNQKNQAGTSNRYSYRLPNVTSFAGLNTPYYLQSVESKKNAIVLLDFQKGVYSDRMTFGSNVKSVYVKGAGNYGSTGFEFNNDRTIETDLCLDRFSLSASGTSGICVLNGGGFNLRTIDSVSIRGGSRNNGISACGARLTIRNRDTLTISGGNGSRGTDGANYLRDQENGRAGTSRSGGNGTDGSSGGTGISANELTIDPAHGYLAIFGGSGGDGGMGGDGEGSDHDGRPRAGDGGNGGNGGDGGCGIEVGALHVYLNENGFFVYGGAGGAGGAAGRGGNGRQAHYSDHGGMGGDGGSGGNGADAIRTKTLDGRFGSLNLSVGSGAGGKGCGGNYGGNGWDSYGKADNGRGGNGGDSGNSGNGIVIRSGGDPSLPYAALETKINVGSVYPGGEIGKDGTGNGNPASGVRHRGKDGVAGKKIFR